MVHAMALGLRLLALCHAAPALPQLNQGPGLQTILNELHSPHSVSGDYVSEPNRVEHTAINLELVRHPSFADHQLRLGEPTICDPTVQQYSGYLDVADDKHLFFWFFEARHAPEDAPLMLWLNGGPGTSTMASGLLFEHGPCTVPLGSTTTARNAHSWNEKANIIYMDQPVGTGYSHGEPSVTTLAGVAADVHAFLQLFLRRFPVYAARGFHLAGESWGGHYVPHIAAFIHAENPRPGQVRVNLESVVLANGLTDPAVQLASNVDYLCGGAPYPPFAADDWRCQGWRAATPTCVALIRSCYEFRNNATCVPATTYCWGVVQGAPLMAANKNPYDLRKECREEDQDALCYPQIQSIVEWLNATSTKLALGVDPALNFTATNLDVNAAFYRSGQAMLNSAALLVPLVNSGVRLMAYAGDVDGMCNYMGIERWMSRLEHDFHSEFEAAPTLPWTTKSGRYAGNVRAAGSGAGNVTFVRIFDAGHMAPYDQPEASLDMIVRWIDNRPFV